MNDLFGTAFLDGKTALVTGAGRGLGRTIALALASAGASVAANDLTPVNLDETIAQAQRAGGRMRPYLEDIAKGMPAIALVEQVVEDFGRIDVLVNNAGVRPRAALMEMDEWDWQRTIDVNLNGPFMLMKAAGKRMREQGGGVIINVAGPCPGESPAAGYGAYYASKTGLLGLTRAAAAEFLTYNINVHAVCVGEAARPADPVPGGRQPQSGNCPNLTMEISELVLFLCSPAAAGLSGQVFQLNTVQATGKG